MSVWSLYWITRLDDMKDFFELLTALMVISAVILAVAYGISWLVSKTTDEEDDENKKAVVVNLGVRTLTSKIVLPLLVVSILFCTFVPTTKEYLAIISVSYITQNERVVTTADKLLDAVDEYLDKRLEGEKVKEVEEK